MERLEKFLDFQYQMIAVLGEENQTMLVRDVLTGRMLVRKLLPAEMFGIYRELKGIRHRNLMQILDVYQVEEGCLVYEEYVNGCSLQDLARRMGRLPKKEACRIILDLCEGLSALHEKNLVHRGVNPKSVRLNQDGILKLMDFGFLRQITYEKPKDTVLLGYPGYAAPEQYGFSESDNRTDIYAVGVLLNLLLTGHPPERRLYYGDRTLRRVIRTCIQVDKTKRYEDVKKLMEEMKKRLPSSEDSSSSVNNGKKTAYSVMQRFYKKLPGVRSDAWYYKAIALVVYSGLLVASYFIILFSYDVPSTLGHVFLVLLELLQLWVPAAVLTNAADCVRLSIMPDEVKPHFRLILAFLAWMFLEILKEFFD